MDNRYALLFIRGEKPVLDRKYDIMKHPNIGLTADGGAGIYRHGADDMSIASLTLSPDDIPDKTTPQEEKRDILVLTEEELEEMIGRRREKKAEGRSS